MIADSITHERRNYERRSASVDELVRDAHVVLASSGVHMSPSKVSRLVRSYKRRVEPNGWAFFDFLANAVRLSEQQCRDTLLDPKVRRVIGAYADPTGEKAVATVMGEKVNGADSKTGHALEVQLASNSAQSHRACSGRDGRLGA